MDAKSTVGGESVTTPNQPPAESGGGGKSPFTRKMGPLPLWAWMGIALGVLLAYSMWNKNKSANSQNAGLNPFSTSQAQAPGSASSANLIPQFVNQVYNQETPPPAENVTVNNTIPVPPTVQPNEPGPEPSTISSSPGSYTTGLAGSNDEWTSTGKYSLNTLAKSHGMTAQQLLAVSEASENNVGLKAYAAKGNFNAPVPSGVHIYIPKANWAVK